MSKNDSKNHLFQGFWPISWACPLSTFASYFRENERTATCKTCFAIFKIPNFSHIVKGGPKISQTLMFDNPTLPYKGGVKAKVFTKAVFWRY